jgi:hypothetical protein
MQVRIAQAEFGEPAGAVVDQARNLDEQVERRADDRAVSDACDAEWSDQEDDAEQDADVEHDRGEGGQQEMVVAVEDAHDDAADRKDERADQQNPHERDGFRLLIRREAGRDDVADDPGSGDEGDDADQQGDAED